MPSSLAPPSVKRKRKHAETKTAALSTAKKPKPSALTQEGVLALEGAIVESAKHYNNIATLQTCFADSLDADADADDDGAAQMAVSAAVALCRSFCRLMAKGRLRRRKDDDPDAATVVAWLRERYRDYVGALCAALGHRCRVQTLLTLLMRLVKDEGTHLRPDGEEYYFPSDTFSRIVKGIVAAENIDDETKAAWVGKYVDGYDDVRYSFFVAVKRLLDDDECGAEISPSLLKNTVDLLLLPKNLPTAETEEITSFYAVVLPGKPSSASRRGKAPTLLSPGAHRKAVQEAWCSVLRRPLPAALCKSVLHAAEQRIVPSFTRPQLLMDFLVGCYDHGGTVSLLALNALFHLISTKNLDYPNFFAKLYALLDRDLLHVRYRSRFFRLLDTFLASTHLPAALIASFIKRMARLCLAAPPGAIVVVVPFVYNLFKKHRATTYMLHRIPVDADEAREWSRGGYVDPFDEDETDPLQTGAIESSVWELETLMSHWHPNVATLCRIVKEQFTKERYLMEDFLDHTYSSMFDVETNREIKKAPVVEVDVPKKIFFRPAGTEEQQPSGNILLDLWSFE